VSVRLNAVVRRGYLERPADEGYETDAFFAASAQFGLAYRLTVRLFQIATLDGGARTTTWKLLLVGFVVLDVALYRVMGRPNRIGFKTRVALDSADIALWSLAPYPAGVPYVVAVLVGIPLALEAGFRSRLGGVVVPVFALATTAAARMLADRPVLPALFLWLVLGVACGILLRRYVRSLHDESSREWSQRRSAQHRLVYLAGQNSVAMGASSVVDGIEAVVPILGRPESGSVLEQFANAWKTSLYQSTVGEAAYLGQVLSEWAGAHNRHPDLTSRVEFNLAEGAGTTLLTNDQESELHRQLSDLELRGVLPVALEDDAAAQRPPGGCLRLRVGSHVLELPPDADQPPSPCDPAPAAFVLAAFIMLSDVIAIPVTFLGAVPAMGLSLGAAWWAHLRLRRSGKKAWPSIIGAAVVVGLAYAVTGTLGLTHAVDEAGVENYPVDAGLELLALLAGMYWVGLGNLTRSVAIAGAVGIVIVSWLLHPLGQDPARAVLQGLWALPLLLGTLALARELDARSARYAEELEAKDAEVEAEIFRHGQDSVLGLVGKARDEAYERFDVVEASLTPQLAGNVRNRLQEVDRRLAKLAPSSGSSSSMTMN
jgi:hypothetical protein